MTRRGEMDRLARIAERQGCDVRRMTGGHRRITGPNGSVTISGSPRADYAVQLAAKDLRRIGVVL